MLDKWILEQQIQTDLNTFAKDAAEDNATATSSPADAYLAYPELCQQRTRSSKDDASSSHSYDFISDEDIPFTAGSEAAEVRSGLANKVVLVMLTRPISPIRQTGTPPFVRVPCRDYCRDGRHL